MFLKELIERYQSFLPPSIRFRRVLLSCLKENVLDLGDVEFKRSGGVVVVFAHGAIKQSILMRGDKIRECLARSGFKIEKII